MLALSRPGTTDKAEARGRARTRPPALALALALALAPAAALALSCTRVRSRRGRARSLVAMAMCEPLWPAPACGWYGQCVNDTRCECSGGFELNPLAVGGAQACIILPGVLRLVYWVSLGATGTLVLVSMLIEALECRRAGRRYRARKRVVAFSRVAATAFSFGILLRCVLLEKQFFFDRVSTWLLFAQSLAIDVVASLLLVGWTTVAKKTAIVGPEGSERAPRKFPTMSTLDRGKLVARLALMLALVLAASMLVLLPSVPLAAALRAFLLVDMLCSAARLGTSLRALQPVRSMYRELAETSELFEPSMVPVTKKRLEELETVRATLIILAASKLPGHSLQLLWPFATSTAVYAWPIAMACFLLQILAWEILALVSTRRYIGEERKLAAESHAQRTSITVGSPRGSSAEHPQGTRRGSRASSRSTTSTSGSTQGRRSSVSVSSSAAPPTSPSRACKKSSTVEPSGTVQQQLGGTRAGDCITQEHKMNAATTTGVATERSTRKEDFTQPRPVESTHHGDPTPASPGERQSQDYSFSSSRLMDQTV